VYNSIDEAFGNMMKNNNGLFSYRCLLKTPYREAIIQSMKVNLGVDNDLNYDEAINGKNVLIFDDTVTTGKTISDSGRAIYEMFAPNTLTYVTLFSPLRR
jgi:hypoxanthine-guanine phosphoribosyltransferase